MVIESLEVGVFAENCYIVGCSDTGAGVVIDPGDELDRILDKIQELGLLIRFILLTHGHLDHVMQVPKLKEKTGAPVLMHAEDEFLLDNLPQQAAAFGLVANEIPKVDKYLKEGDTVEFGNVSFSVLHTPGHSPGSISFVTKGVAFVGDALFAGSVGRTDLPGGSYDVLIRSIRSKLLSLEEATLAYPGHGPVTTIGRERETNPFLIA